MICSNCGRDEDCIIINEWGDEIAVFPEEAWAEFGEAICCDCHSMIYGGGWNEDWYRDDGWR